MTYNPDWIRVPDRIERYGILCQFHERLLIASQLLEECIDEFGEILDAHPQEPESRIFR